MQWNITQPWKEWNNTICSNMDQPRDYHINWSKSDRETWKEKEAWYHLHAESKKNDIKELTYKIETDSQT